MSAKDGRDDASDLEPGSELPDLAQLETARLASPAELHLSREQQLAEHEAAIAQLEESQHVWELHIAGFEERQEGSAEDVRTRLEQRIAAAWERWHELDLLRLQHEKAIDALHRQEHQEQKGQLE